MKQLIFAMSGLALAAAVAGCANDEDQRAKTSPMYSAETGAAPTLTQTCAYTVGPLSGQTIDYSGQPGVPAVQVGNRCADMRGSSGTAVAQQPGRAPSGRFYSSPGAPIARGPAGAVQPGYSLYCRFNRGPAAGHTADYSSTLGAKPAPIGSACADGPNRGVAVGE